MNISVDLVPQAAVAVPCHDAVTLTAGGALAHIALNGQIYSLRITRAGKLILTK
jgi:hemin uptake protein HemP